MTDMRQTAQRLAAKGRYGDTRLLHVSPLELQGLASLMPGGRLTINPETGLPEAFFFLPFLASLFGAAAPAATAAAAAAPAVLGTAATTAATAGTAAAAAAPAVATGLGATGATGLTGLLHAAGSVPGMVAKGIGSMFGGGAAAVDPIVTGATAAPAAASAQALPAVTTAIPTANPLLSGPATALRHIGGAGSTAGQFASNPAATVLRHVGGAGSGAANFAAGPATTTTTAVQPLTQTGKEIGSGVLGWMSKNPMLALGGISMLSSALKGMGGKKKDKDDDRDPNDLPTYDASGSPVFPGSDYSAGHSSEWNYFPNYNYRPHYANGGIVSLADGGGVDLQAQQPQDQGFPLNGVPGTDEAPQMEDIPSSSYPTSQVGAPQEPPANDADTVEAPTGNDKELIMQTVEALQGKLGNPRPILLAFVQNFGEQALQDLAMKVKNGVGGGKGGGGPNDGQSDSIPAMIDGQQPAALSEGEYVMPADVVSHLGNGSTDAGAKHLDKVVSGVRQAKTGSAGKPPPINPGYASGGLVTLYR